MLLSCSMCPGFVPPNASVCPHCGGSLEAAAAEPSGSIAKKVGMGAAAGAMMMTLMACYGDSYYSSCYSDYDCLSGETCNEYGECVSGEICNNGYDDDYDGYIDAADPDCTNEGEYSCDDGY